MAGAIVTSALSTAMIDKSKTCSIRTLRQRRWNAALAASVGGCNGSLLLYVRCNIASHGSSDPCKGRKRVEKPIGKRRHVARDHGDPHCDHDKSANDLKQAA